MKFFINQLNLWLDNGKQRDLKFENNKVNIITGEQSKGKSTIIEIIDYCFLASENPIAQDIDYLHRVEWFGINFHINDKIFTIIRHAKNLQDYYFSSSGEIPKIPYVNVKEENIKNSIFFEFGINDNVIFPFGGKEIKKGSKISPRYFMLFNTQRRDTLSSDKVLFDKQTILKQQEALTRIFDIAIGATTIENLIKKELLAEHERKLSTLELKEEKLLNKTSLFYKEQSELCKKAKHLNLIDINLSVTDCIKAIKENLIDTNKSVNINNQVELQTLEEKKLEINLKISKYKKYIKQYSDYKKLLANDLDSLIPIKYLAEHYDELLKVNQLDTIINNLKKEFVDIRKFLTKKESPSVINLQKTIDDLNLELSNINDNIEKISNSNELKTTRKDQLIFLGEAKVKIGLYEEKDIDNNYWDEIKSLKKKIKRLEKDIQEVDRSDILDSLSEYMQEVFKEIDFELSGYSNYKPVYDYKSKLIYLKQLDKKIIYKDNLELIKNIGSSSNHLFLHLAFFSSIHRLFIKQKIPFIPQFLILDQPDSPYYDTSNENSSEKEVFFKALKVLDNHIELFNKTLKKDFQIIVLEHVDWKEIEKSDFNHYHLVEEWRDDNSGLVPKDMLNEEK